MKDKIKTIIEQLQCLITDESPDSAHEKSESKSFEAEEDKSGDEDEYGGAQVTDLGMFKDTISSKKKDQSPEAPEDKKKQKSMSMISAMLSAKTKGKK